MSTRTLSIAFALTAIGTHAHAAEPLQALDSAGLKQADPAVVELGHMLFFDPRLSGDASTACSDCHDPNYGWSDGSELARGYPGTKHWRNSQTVVNMGFMTEGFHWDSGLASLSDQVHDAMGAGFVANIDTVLAEERLRQIPEYVERFGSIWGEAPSQDKIADAIAAYEQSLISDDSPFDLHMSGQSNAMSAAALRGMALFDGKANCSSCHNGALISDQKFYNTSVPPNVGLSEEPLRQVTFRYLMRLKGLEPAVYEALDRDPGRYLATQNPDDLGMFRTPPLRYLKYTAPYMHNGIFYSLDEVVEFYNIGGTQDVFGTKSPLIKPLGLTRDEKNDLVAFLESLSGSELTADVPALPDYEVQSFPASNLQITAASLKGGTALAPRKAVAEPAQSTGSLDLTPAVQTESSGLLVMAPKDAGATASAITVTVPAEPGTRVVTIGGQRFVTVQPGDTLGTLAKLIYGDGRQYQKLFNANRDKMSNPNALVTGMRLRVPD
ncbi:cytochrome c peroxidase [Litoreibacter roseus]|uniref:Cytochrome c peroxidase n=1 Tax=Litoreibacter roseus TaxID=2601869 RepID=A0A6N6JI77_9RHOB|nr:cytochrome c peroxidase [Litoreibacter roseus]GFE65109.1 hypothetical protein KIN_21830 [Litoreibacter roseus]